MNIAKNIREEVKVTLLNKEKYTGNLQGTNRREDETDNQINDLEHKAGKSIQSEQQEEKRIKKKKKTGLRTSGTTLNIPIFKS